MTILGLALVYLVDGSFINFPSSKFADVRLHELVLQFRAFSDQKFIELDAKLNEMKANSSGKSA